MKKTQKLLSIVMALLMIASGMFLIAPSAAEYTSGVWRYEYVRGEAILTYYGGGARTVETPETIDGYPVIGLRNTFAENSDVEKIIVSEGVKTIESAMTRCQNLVSVILPESLEEIRKESFYDSPNLEKVEIKEGVTSIGYRAFSDCDSLTDVKLPSTLTAMGEYAFMKSGITEVTIPGGVEIIPFEAFYDCDNLKKVTICEGVEVIDHDSFAWCSSLTEVFIPRSVVGIYYYHPNSNPFVGSYNLTVRGYENSYAETFADDCGYKFDKLVPVTGVTILPETAKIEIFGTVSLNATITPENATNKNVVWSTSDNAIAAVDADGKVMGKANGTATIIVTTEDGHFSDTCTVTVHSHIYTTAVTLQPTCTKNGIKTYTCSCNDSLTESIPKLGHDYIDKGITAAPTCTGLGLRKYECSRCRDSYTTTVAATGHSYVDKGITVAPTCTESGLRTFECSKCRDSYTSVVPDTGHSYGPWTTVVEPTAEENGTEIRNCKNCTHSQERSIPKLLVISNTSLDLVYKSNAKLSASSDDVTWSTSDSRVVSVDNKGNITAIGRGEAVITATDNETGMTATCNVKVSYTWWQWLIVIFLLGFIWY